MLDATSVDQSEGLSASPADRSAPREGTRDARGPFLVPLPLLSDERGALTFGEEGKHLPFTPRRYFAIFGVPSGETRGHHAHRRIDQFLVCLRGACTVELQGPAGRSTERLDGPTRGLVAPPLTWVVMRDFSADALLLVLASDVYDEAEYVRDFDEFQRLVGR